MYVSLTCYSATVYIYDSKHSLPIDNTKRTCIVENEEENRKEKVMNNIRMRNVEKEKIL